MGSFALSASTLQLVVVHSTDSIISGCGLIVGLIYSN